MLSKASIAHSGEHLEEIVVEANFKDVFNGSYTLQPDSGVIEVLGELPEPREELLDDIALVANS